MKRYIRAASSNELNYNYYLLDFLKKLGIRSDDLHRLQDKRGNLRDTTYFGRSHHDISLGDVPHVKVDYSTQTHVGRGDTFDVMFSVFCDPWYHVSQDEKDEIIRIINHIIDVAESCDYITSISDIHKFAYSDPKDADCFVTLTFLKPETHVPKKKTRLDKYVDKYGLEFVYMVGTIFDRRMNPVLIDQEPYRTKIAESGCSMAELEEIARYLHNSVSLGVGQSGTYYIKPKSAYDTGSAVGYTLPYKDYNEWLGEKIAPTIGLGRLGSVPLFEDNDE